MGTTGPDLFSDDLAMDIRAAFREMIADGLTPEDATHRLITDYDKDPAVIDYNDEDPVFWLALAATGWSTGRLLPHIKQTALEIIDAGADIHRWEQEVGHKPAAKRRQVLDNLRAKLLSPQPAPKKIRPIYHDRTDWEVGHAVAYRLLSGRRIIFRILHVEDRGKSRTAIADIADIADWIPSSPDADLPPASTIRTLKRLRPRGFAEHLDDCRTPRLRESHPATPRDLAENLRTILSNPAERNVSVNWSLNHDGKLALYALHPRHFPTDRLQVIATGLRFTPRVKDCVGAAYFGGWKRLDAYLADDFDLH